VSSFDIWLYPENLNNENLVVNLWFEYSENQYYADFYSLPDNWRDKVTKNKGQDGKPSIHDIMI